MNCAKCGNEIVTLIIHEIPKDRYNIFKIKKNFCSRLCIEEYKKTNQCQSCESDLYMKTFINGYAVCSNDSENMKYTSPTCQEEYTKKYSCFKCNSQKNVDEERCYILGFEKINDMYMCQTCFSKYFDGIYDKYQMHRQWIYVDKRLSNKIYFEDVKDKFICNICHELKNINEINIDIKEFLNICDKCK